MVKISTSLLSQRSLTPTVRLVVAAVRPLRAEGPELLRGMNYLFFCFFLNVVVICEISLTARRHSWPCFLPLLLRAESYPKEKGVRDTGEA